MTWSPCGQWTTSGSNVSFSGGNVLVGLTSQSSPARQLEVANSARIYGSAGLSMLELIPGTGTGYRLALNNDNTLLFQSSTDAFASNSTLLMKFNAGNTELGGSLKFPDGTTQSTAMNTERRYRTIGATIDGGGSVITTGGKGFIYVPYNCTIDQWTLLADQSGSVVIDVKRSTYAGFPTTTSIIGAGNKPTLSTAQKNQAVLSSWTSSTLTAGDVLEFTVSSATTLTRVHVALRVIQ